MSSIDILRANSAAVSLLAGIGVNIGDAATLASAAQAKVLEQKTAEEAAMISGLITGFEALAIGNVTQQVNLAKQLEAAQKDLAEAAKAKDYMMNGGSGWPLKALLGFPVPKDIKEANLHKVPEGWTVPTATASPQ
jgi:enoyl-CoA hydratase/carnithine racemase